MATTAAELEAEEGSGPYLPNITSQNDLITYMAGKGIQFDHFRNLVCRSSLSLGRNSR